MVEWHWARPRGMVGGTEGDKVQVKCENLVTGYLMSNVYVCECVCVWMDGWMDGKAWSCRNRGRSVWRGRGAKGGGREGSISLLCTLDPITFCRSHKARMMLDVAAGRCRRTRNS